MGDTDVTHTARRRHTTRKKSADAWPEKRVKTFRERAKKERDSSENEWTLSLFALTSDAHKTSLFLFFFLQRHLFLTQNASLVATKIKNTSTTSTRNNKKNYGRFESQRYARDARARRSRAVDVLDREMRSIAHRPRSSSRNFFHRDLERGNFSENEFDQISLSLSFVFRRISFCVVPVFEFRRARARFYTATLTHSRVFFLS
jgi:hypothetical protein